MFQIIQVFVAASGPLVGFEMSQADGGDFDLLCAKGAFNARSTALILIEAPSSAYHMVCWGWEKLTRRGGDLMRFYTQQHKCYGGIDLHARTMYLGVLHQAGEILLHRHMTAVPEPFLKAIAPDRDDLIVCVECLFTWDLARGPLRPGRHADEGRACWTWAAPWISRRERR
jgi:hypothetical protein